MHHRIRTPRPPCLGQRIECFRTQLGRIAGGDAAQDQVRGGKRIRMAQRAHRHVMRGPFADAGQGDPARHEFVQRLLRAEIDAAVQQGLRHATDRGGARGGHADLAQVRIGQLRRRGEQAFQSRCNRRRQWFAVALHDTRRQRARGRHADLLAEHGAHRDLEAVPAAGQAQARAPAQQRLQHAAGAERGGDRLRLRIEVEHPPQPRHHRQQLRRLRAVQFQFQCMLTNIPGFIGPSAQAQPARCIRRAEHAHVTVFIDQFNTRQ